MSEASALATFIYSRLKSDETLMGLVTDVHRGTAPKSAVFPYVEFLQVGPGIDQFVVSRERYGTDFQVQVNVCGKDAPISSLDAAADRVDELLKLVTNVTVGSHLVVFCYRTQVRPFDDPAADGVLYPEYQQDFTLLVQ